MHCLSSIIDTCKGGGRLPTHLYTYELRSSEAGDEFVQVQVIVGWLHGLADQWEMLEAGEDMKHHG
jgi:hypothetical protein